MGQVIRFPNGRRVLSDQAAACMGKQTFETFESAMKVGGRKTTSRPRRAVYKCKHCGKYHIGSTITLKKRRPEW